MSVLADQMRKVSFGLGLVFTSVILAVLITIGLFVGGLMVASKMAPVPPGQKPVIPADMPPVFMVGMVGMLASSVLAVTGKIYCLNAPEKAQATTPIYLAVVLDVVGLVASVGAQIPATASAMEPIAPFAGMLSMVGYCAFLIFLRRIAEFVGSEHLANRARGILVWSIYLVPTYIVLLAILLSKPNVGLTAIAGLGSLVVAVIALVLLVRYTNLLAGLRKLINVQLDGYYEEP
jgi:hypothetical protein